MGSKVFYHRVTARPGRRAREKVKGKISVLFVVSVVNCWKSTKLSTPGKPEESGFEASFDAVVGFFQ